MGIALADDDGKASERSMSGTLFPLANPAAPRRRGPRRSTVPLFLELRPEVRARAQAGAERLGLTLSGFVSDLVIGRDPAPPPAIDAGSIAQLGAGVARLLDELGPRLMPVERAMVDELRAHVLDALARLRNHYDLALDASDDNADAWAEYRVTRHKVAHQAK
jgi:hypothetical protein